MLEILSTITKIVDAYNSGRYNTPDKLRKMQRGLTSNIYYLTKYQIDSRNEWIKEYHAHDGNNAASERVADRKVPELYLCRKIIEAAKGVSISMGYELGIMKSEA